jgi:hypothetical protein
MTLSIGLAIAGLAVGLARLLFYLWQRRKIQQAYEESLVLAGRIRDGAAALWRRYRQIDEAPPSQRPADDLNDEWENKP